MKILNFDSTNWHRKAVDIDGVATWIVSREDLILSKLAWALDSRSDLQLRDVRSLLDEVSA
jgi:hypothetical protein